MLESTGLLYCADATNGLWTESSAGASLLQAKMHTSIHDRA